MRLRPREPSLILLTWALVGVTRAIALNILCGGDDSWGTANIRALYYHLRAAGHAVVIAAPALQQSGTRGTIRPATPLVHDGEFGLVKKGAPAEGHDVHDDRVWYINSSPAASIQYGIDVLSPRLFGGPPDLVITGVNQGHNLGLAYLASGTFGAAYFALERYHIPAIALSAGDSTVRSHGTLGGAQDQANIYAHLAVQLVQRLIEDGKPHLPFGVGLNVNMPSAAARGCTPTNSRFVFTRLLRSIDHDPDICTCVQTYQQRHCKLPNERTVMRSTPGCTVTISPFVVDLTHPVASKQEQQDLVKRLHTLVSCP